MKKHGAKTGFFTVDNKDYYGIPSRGYVVRGKFTYNDIGMLLADNDGVLQGFPSGLGGWLVTGKYDGGELQRYRIDDCCGGHAGAHTGLFVLDGSMYYGLPDTGYELRNAIQRIQGTWFRADNDGKLTETYSPVETSMFGALTMILAGLFPPIGAFFTTLPSCVLGGCTVIMFGSILTTGIKMMHGADT